jgi:hypothetical protein
MTPGGHQQQTRTDPNGKTAAQNRWIAYNKLRGQYSSAMEHAVPEQFWVDKSQCRYTDETGTIKNPTLADCAQAVSAVKAIAIAQAEGQRSTPSTKATQPRHCPSYRWAAQWGRRFNRPSRRAKK